MEIGVFAVDPGGATGLAWGMFDPTLKDVGDQLRQKRDAGSATVSGSERTQIRGIVSHWRDFYQNCVRSGLPANRVWFVCEDFIYAPGVNYEGDSGKISTALIWGVEGYRMGREDEWRQHRRGGRKMPDMILQSASEAKGFATGVRLREWDCWVVGKDHERSAFQHIAFFLKKYQLQRIG